MADNVTYTQGSGSTVATDDISGVHYQRVKVAVGADGSATDLVGSATYGAYVDPRRTTVRKQITPTISSGSAYTSGDCLGPITQVANAARISGGGGRIQGIQILDKTQAQRAAMTILLFNQNVTTAADNAAFTCSDTDMLNLVAQIEILSTHYNTAWAGTPANSIATIPHNDAASTPLALNVPFVCATTDLYMQLVVRGTPTYTSTSDIVVSFIIEQD